ncbi:MAG: hypothetical protein LAN62_11590 [Acidobacteriia bacterium]|nr:hypothetical protein [Terriglobia bacterium]
MILVVVEDLVFLSKIQQTAQMLGIPVEAVAPTEAHERACAPSVSAVIVDLNPRSGSAIDLVKALKADARIAGTPVIGFLSHVQGDLAAAARTAGCDRVLARSAMAKQLPELLKAVAHKDPTATPRAPEAC